MPKEIVASSFFIAVFAFDRQLCVSELLTLSVPGTHLRTFTLEVDRYDHDEHLLEWAVQL